MPGYCSHQLTRKTAIQEDAVVPLGIINILYSSISEDKQLLTTLKLRSWIGQLLQRSILLGSLQEGLSMHDIGEARISPL